MVTLRVDSDPSGGTLRLGDAVLPLPASLDRTMGTRLDLLVEKPGYEPHAVELVFTETGTKVGGLKELPRPPKPAPAVKRKRAGDDEYDWGKQIYVRPGDSQAK